MFLSNKLKNSIIAKIKMKFPYLDFEEINTIRMHEKEFKIVIKANIDHKRLIAVKKASTVGKVLSKGINALESQIELHRNKNKKNLKSSVPYPELFADFYRGEMNEQSNY